MAIRDIVLHLGTDARAAARFDIAIALAQAHEAAITGVLATTEPGAPGQWWPASRQDRMAEWLAGMERVHADLEQAFTARLGEEGLSGGWRIMQGSPGDVLTACARRADLTIIGQTDPREPVYGAGMPHQLVLGAGAPVLVVPYAGSFKTVGKRILVAWDGGREATRAVRDAMPLLERADTVMIHVINPADDATSAGADITAWLASHGVKATASHAVLGPETAAVSSTLQTVGGFGFQQRGAWSYTRRPPMGTSDVGNALLSAVTDDAADLLVMGAYGHGRLREFALGGATREVLGSMTVPVLMSH